jgi:hypothetical protein
MLQRFTRVICGLRLRRDPEEGCDAQQKPERCAFMSFLFACEIEQIDTGKCRITRFARDPEGGTQ